MKKTSENAQLEFDHIVLFVNDSSLYDSLTKDIFTPATKLETKHTEQGTYGMYFLFYNTFIELLYLDDESNAIKNIPRFGSNYIQRWNHQNCPFGFGLNLIPFDTTAVTGVFTKYQSLDAPKDDYYLMSRYNSISTQPMIYASMPHRAYTSFNTLEEVDKKVEEYKRADLKSYLTHPNNAKELTKVVLTIPEKVALDKNIALLQPLEKVEIQVGKQYELMLIFDEQKQGKQEVFNDLFLLTIKY